MARFTVTISRSAVEVCDLAVSAHSQDAAERKISKLLDKPHRVGVDELVKARGVKVTSLDLYGDEESSWEIV